MESIQARPMKRGLRVAPFLAAALLFVMPFLGVSCMGQRVVSLSGIQMVTGAEVRVMDSSERIPSNEWVAATFFATVAAIAFCFSPSVFGAIWAAALGAVGFASMLLAKVQIDNEVLEETGGMVSVEYLIGWIGVCFLLLAGTVLNGYYYHAQRPKSEEVDSSKPPNDSWE